MQRLSANGGQRGKGGAAGGAAGSPVPIHRVRGNRRALTHLFGDTSSRRPRPPRPPPGVGGTRAVRRPPAGTTGGAARELAGGAGRGRPSAAGRSRAAAGSDTCRAPPPQPPRPLRAREEGAWRRPATRRDGRRGEGTVGASGPAPSGSFLTPPRARGKVPGSRDGDGQRDATAAAAAADCAAGWREQEGNPARPG
jgi:hypothetical protein